MSGLVDRYPHIRRVSAPQTTANDTEQVYPLIEPYLDWTLAEIDTYSSDILLLEPPRHDGLPHIQGMVILSGRAVNIWLRHQTSSKRGKT
jgi:hypothetical protein